MGIKEVVRETLPSNFYFGSEIGQYRNFTNGKEKSLYISFLNLELNLINRKMEKIKKNAMKLYMEKINNPESNVSKRCCNFKLLEEKSKLYNKNS